MGFVLVCLVILVLVLAAGVWDLRRRVRRQEQASQAGTGGKLLSDRVEDLERKERRRELAETLNRASR